MTEPYLFPTSADEFAEKRVLVTDTSTIFPLSTAQAFVVTVRPRNFFGFF